MSDRIVKSLGHHGFWGLSATFDFVEALCKSSLRAEPEAEAEAEPIRILLVQPGDIRHVLTTIARRRRSGLSVRRPLHFYLLESDAAVVARELLLLEILNDFEVPIRQRANIFLEVFGNIKVQDRTSR